MATGCKDYDFRKIEPHWQSFWEENRAYRAQVDATREKAYVLDMFPYPSGSGLHVGHPEGYTASDIVSRYLRARGRNVLHPIGWDAFGLPAEQHAVKTGTHPAENTRNNIATFRRQIKSLGFSYDWEREIDTTDPKYYRWTQWIFLQLFRRGLAYVDERPVWWCPGLCAVLANEEVVDGKSEVGGFPVERRNLRQWVLRITAYAERLLADLAKVDWPDSTKRMQAAWIGRSEGAELAFATEKPGTGPIRVFTTRPDTLFGCTYLVLAPEHPLVDSLCDPSRAAEVAAYRRAAAAKSDLERTDLAKEKSGVFTGAFAVNPINGTRVPIWVADYVLTGYGTGAIMAVPAHDERDWEFARRFQLPIVEVVKPGDAGAAPASGDRLFVEYGVLVNSGPYTGLESAEAGRRITADLAARNAGQPTVNYKLRDWLFSRQRYWGEPIPIVWVSRADYDRAMAARPGEFPPQPVAYTEGDATHYAVPLPEAALPLELPAVESYLPSGSGESPLARAGGWLDVWFDVQTGAAVPGSQPKPSGAAWIRARRETNTMPQWAGSCWYYLRFEDPANDRAFAGSEALRYWGVPDLYIGGAEHAVLHLLYARFWHKVLFDIGAVPQDEPFRRLFHQGTILGEDGEKMSKSRGNVVNPDSVVESHGADTLRLYLMFLGPLEASKPWSPRGIEGPHRFLQSVWRLCLSEDGAPSPRLSDAADEGPELLRLWHATVKKVGEDIEGLRLNTAISQMMILLKELQKAPSVRPARVKAFLQLLAPFAPHIAEELWARLGGGGTIDQAPWPAYDPAQMEGGKVKLVFQVNGKHRGDAEVEPGLAEADAVKLALEHPKVAAFAAGKPLRKVIYVPGRILNLVVAT